MYVRLGFSVQRLVLDIIGLYQLCIMIRAILSWFASPLSGAMQFFIRITEPLLSRVRGVLARFMGYGRFDFSPVVAILLLELLKRLILWL